MNYQAPREVIKSRDLVVSYGPSAVLVIQVGWLKALCSNGPVSLTPPTSGCLKVIAEVACLVKMEVIRPPDNVGRMYNITKLITAIRQRQYSEMVPLME